MFYNFFIYANIDLSSQLNYLLSPLTQRHSPPVLWAGAQWGKTSFFRSNHSRDLIFPPVLMIFFKESWRNSLTIPPGRFFNFSNGSPPRKQTLISSFLTITSPCQPPKSMYLEVKINTHTYTHMHRHTRIRTLAHAQIRTHTQTHTHAHVWTDRNTRTQTHTHTLCTHTHTHTHTHTNTYAHTHKIAIKTAKRKCWQDFCEEVDSDPWGRPYKTVMNKIKPRGTSTPSYPTFLDKVVQSLFPQHRERRPDTGLTEDIGAAEPTAVTESEVKIAAKKIAIRKAPGLDGVPGLVIKTAALNVSYIFKETFSACLSEGIFPAQWKIQRLVLLPKGNKPPDEPSAYRPVCMLHIVGKLFERIISVRLEAAIQQVGGLSDNQFSFRKGQSTIDAIDRVVSVAKNTVSGSRWTKRMCAIIGLDVWNAFNTVRWDKIMLALEDLSVPLYLRRVTSNYLTDRTLLFDTDDGRHSYKITGGVPQDSVLGSPIWNILYDGLLRQTLPHGVFIVAYADGIALIIVGKTIEDVQYLGDMAIEVVGNWLSDQGLTRR